MNIYKFGNPYRGYLSFEANSPQDAWLIGCDWFNKSFPHARGRGVVLFERVLVPKSLYELESWQLDHLIEESVPVLTGKSTSDWAIYE